MTRVRVMVLAVLLIAAGCASDDGAADSDRQEVLSIIANEVMVPAYTDVAANTSALTASIAAACADPGSAAALEPARRAWSDSRGSWLATRAFRFGPATTLRTMSTIDFPVDTAKIDDLLASDEPINAGTLADLGADQRGLEGIEYVLYAEAPLDERSCNYLTAASTLVADASEAVLTGWTAGLDGGPSFLSQISEPGVAGGMYANTHAAYEDLINSMIFAIADVADARIGRASGDVTGTPLPHEVDAGRARRAKQDAIDVIAGVQALYERDRHRRLQEVVASISDETAATMSADLQRALDALDALDDPLADATDPAPAHAAYEALKKAQVTLRAEIASQLGVTLTFGDADGDS